MKDRKRILVLGGTGFIGVHVLNQLLKRSDIYNVALLAHHNVPFEQLEDTNLYVGDLASFDLDVIDTFKPDYIIHMARIGGKRKLGRIFSSRKGHRANKRLINHLVKRAPKTKVLYISGTLIYGDCGDATVTEETSHNPVSFAREYAYAEEPWRRAQKLGKLDISMLMPPWILGPKSWFKQFFIKPMQENGYVPIYGNSDNWMSILDVEDCAGIIINALSNSESNKDYNLYCPDLTIRMNEFTSLLSKLTDLPVKECSPGEIKKHFGAAASEAFNFSLKSGTLHKEFIESYDFRYKELKDLINKNLILGGWKKRM